MNIYFAWSIRWAKKAQKYYKKIVEHIRQYGDILTEHVAHAYKNPEKYNIAVTKKDIFQADIALMPKANVMIAEVSAPSHGVGWEICYAQHVRKIPILCLHLKDVDVSAMIEGNPYLTLQSYKDIKEAKKIIDHFLKKLK